MSNKNHELTHKELNSSLKDRNQNACSKKDLQLYGRIRKDLAAAPIYLAVSLQSSLINHGNKKLLIRGTMILNANC